jgi:hypothetical protein
MSRSIHRGAGRIVAVGDLHGNFPGLRRILQRTGLIDRRDRWCAHDTHLVQLGDILGRGGEPGKIFRLLGRLEQEAPAFGSRVHVLLGNHEAMSMSGMLMYNTLEEFRDLADQDLIAPSEADLTDGGIGRGAEDGTSFEGRGEPSADGARVPAGGGGGRLAGRLDMLGCREFRDSLSPEGKVGHWLAGHDTAVSIDGCLFVHGGLNRDYGLMPLDTLNETVRYELSAGEAPAPSSDWSPVGEGIVLRREGPQWNREFTLRPESGKQRDLEEVLEYHGCSRMVVGHTPTSCIDPDRAGEILPLYGGRLWCVDTGIGKSYGGRLSALVLEGGAATPIYP